MLIPFAGNDHKRKLDPKLIVLSLREQNKTLVTALNQLRAEYQISLSDLRLARNEIKDFEMRFRLLGRALEAVKQHIPKEQENLFVRDFNVDDVIITTAKHYGLSLDEIKGSSRSRNIMIPRLVAAFLARTLTQEGHALIGMKLGGRDHSTILSAVKRIHRLRLADVRIDHAINLIIHELETRFEHSADTPAALSGSAPALSPSPDHAAGAEPLSSSGT